MKSLFQSSKLTDVSAKQQLNSPNTKAHVSSKQLQRAIDDPNTLTPNVILSLQRSHGNRFVQRLVQQMNQPKISSHIPQNSISREILYRGMQSAGTVPKVGNTARTLGVRDSDVDVVDFNVIANKKGMSTAKNSPRSLPPYRRPPEFDGTGKDPVWQIDDSQLGDNLITDNDHGDHVNVAPARDMSLAVYRHELAKTQKHWTLTPIEETETTDPENTPESEVEQ